MGIDYTPIAGFGIEVSRNEIIENFKFKENEDEEIYIIEEFEESKFNEKADIKEYGSSLSGNLDTVLLMKEPLKNGIEKVSDKLKEFRTFLDENGFKDKEISFIEEIHQW